jgi:hypothetical protein
MCTVRYHDKKETKRGLLYRSHLWKADLGCFEVVKDGEQRRRLVGNTISKAAAIRAAKRAQLRLPLDDASGLP